MCVAEKENVALVVEKKNIIIFEAARYENYIQMLA